MLKIPGDEAKAILQILLIMLIDPFDYVETEAEMHLTLKHFKRYYNIVKSQLKSEYVQKETEHIVLSIETNLKYISYYYFIDVTNFFWETVLWRQLIVVLKLVILRLHQT